MKKFNLKTRDNALRLFWLCVALILLFSFVAQLVSTDFGRLKIQRLTIDARGAEIVGDIYYPRGANEDNPLPAVVVTHGGGCNWGVTKYLAQEIARRGFVTFNFSAYSNGLSYKPMYDELHDKYNEQGRLTPLGVWDAFDYIRTLEFVDPMRLGLTGHSMGAIRTTSSIKIDCGYLNLNDRLINILCDDFGQSFTLEEISQDATALAEARLNADQLAHFNYMKEEATEFYNTRMFAAVPIGNGKNALTDWGPAEVEVAGYTVMRDMQCNIVQIDGEFGVMNGKMDASWYPDLPIESGIWYAADDDTMTNTKLGHYSEITVLDNAGLANAVATRTARMYYMSPNQTHSRDFFSNRIASVTVRAFEQMLGYNNGNLGEGKPTPYTSNIWHITSYCNFFSLITMVFMCISLAAVLVHNKSFECCVAEEVENKSSFNKKRYWAINIFTVVMGFGALYYGIKKANKIFKNTKLFPASTQHITLGLLAVLVIGTLLILAYNVYKSKKENGTSGLERLGLNIGIKGILKSFLLSFVVFTVAYASLQLIVFFFDQDYRLWMAVYTELKANYFGWVIWYAVVLFPVYAVLSAGINYSLRSDIPAWKDDLICVIVNSVGIYILCALNYVIALVSYNGSLFCDFISSYGFLVHVPVTVIIMRLCYRKTKTVWVGAGICAFLIAWAMCSGAGLGNTNVPDNLMAAFLNY